jgi:hypothetical protein
MSSESTEPGFDPRYDPRFQRGWSDGEPDGAARDIRDAPAPAEPAGPPAAGGLAALAPVADPPAVADPADPGDDPPAPVPASDAEDPAEPTEDPARPTVFAEAGSTEPGPQDPQPFLLAPSSGVVADAERDAARVLRIAFTIAWAVAGAATLVGAGLVWSLVSADDPFAMPAGDSELVLRTLAQFAAPNLLATGLLGIVVLTVVDGLRRARRLAAAPVGDDGAVR